MAMEKQKRLIQLLSERTRDGITDWRSGVENDSFVVSFKNYSIMLKEIPIYSDGEGDTFDYRLSLIDEEGDNIESFTDVDLFNEKNSGDWVSSWYNAMKELFQMARRASNGAEKALNEILDELEG